MKAVDLFSGCGGLSLGLQNAGIKICAAYENWAPAIAVYKTNFKHPVNEQDLANVEQTVESIKKYRPDIIVGGPPCQDFSSAGKRNEKGGRGDLTISFAEIIVEIKPTWFLMENVDRIVKTDVFKEAKSILSKSGYGFTQIILDASLCGVPQKRKRMFLIGRLDTNDGFLLEQITNKLSNKRLTVREYFGESLELDHYYRHARSYSRRGIFSVDEPSPTIRGVNRPIPPNYKLHEGDSTKDLTLVRPLNALERSYIQTFPKDFIWPISNKSTLEQIIGNAVPVNLAKFVGDSIIEFETQAVFSKNLTKSQETEICAT